MLKKLLFKIAKGPFMGKIVGMYFNTVVGLYL